MHFDVAVNSVHFTFDLIGIVYLVLESYNVSSLLLKKIMKLLLIY